MKKTVYDSIFYKRFGFKPGRLSYAIEPYYFRIVDQLLDYHIFHPTYYSLLTRQPICKRKVPTVLTVYDMIHEILIEPHKLDRTIELKRYAILSSDMILCISENTKRDLLERYKIPEERIQVTYLATDFPHYPISNDDSYRQAPAVPFSFMLVVDLLTKTSPFFLMPFLRLFQSIKISIYV